jgi:hypothetical protein
MKATKRLFPPLLKASWPEEGVELKVICPEKVFSPPMWQ